MPYVIGCSVSGGMTGYRVSQLKRDGEVIVCDTEEEAEREAEKAREAVKGYTSSATFSYWVERCG